MGEEDKETAANDNEYQAIAAADGSGASFQGKGEDAADDASQIHSQGKQEQEVPSVSSSAATCSDAMLKVTENDTKVESCGDIGEHDGVPNVQQPADEVKIPTKPPKTTTTGGSAAISAATVKASTTINSTKYIDGQLRSPPKARLPQQQQQMNAYPLTQGYHHPHHHPHHPYHSAVAYNHHHPAYRHPHHPAAYHHHASVASFPHPPPPLPQTHGASSSSSAPTTSSHQHHWSSSAVQHAYSGYYKTYHHHQQLQHPQQQSQNQHQQTKKAVIVPSDVSSNTHDTRKRNQHTDKCGDGNDPQNDDYDPDASHDRETKCTNKNKNKRSEDDDALVGGDIQEARSEHSTDEEGSGKKSSSSINEITKNKESSEDNVNSQEAGGDDVQDIIICGDATKKKSTTTRPDTIASSTSSSSVMGVGATASWTSQSDNDNVNMSVTISSSTASTTAASIQRQQHHPSQQQYHSHYGWHHAAAAHHVSGGYHQYHLQQQHGFHPYHLQQQQHQQHNQNSQHHSQLFPQYSYWPGYGGHSQHNVAAAVTSSSSHNSSRSAQQQDVGGAETARVTSNTANIETNEQRAEKMKKRHRNEPSTAIELQQADDDARDDLNTKESFLSDEYNYELDCDNAYHDNEHHDSVLCDEDDDDDTASTGEGDMDCSASISLGSLATSPKGKRRKGPPRAFGRSSSLPVAVRRSQSIHRAKPTGHHLATVETNEGEDNTSLLKVSSTFSEGGKMILKNLSIHSNYSAELAELCGPSPMAVTGSNATDIINDDGMEVDNEGRTPKKRNTKGSKRTQARGGMGSFEFRLDGLTPAPSSRRVLRTSSDCMNMSHENDINNDSPTMFDLMGGAETPTTDMLMSNIMETELTDDIRSLNGHLRGQTFTPLHVDAGSGHSLAGGVDESPQLSWSTTNGGSPLEITPRCFGLLDSTKSGRSFSSVGGGKSIHPLGSPRSFWKDTVLERNEEEGQYNGEQGGVKSILSILSPTMREMDVDHDGMKDLEGESRQSSSPLPLYYSHGQEKCSNESTKEINTPRRVPNNVPSSAEQVSQVHSSHWANDYQHYVRPNSGISHSPIPHHQLHPPHHGAASPYSGGGHPPPSQGYYLNMYNHTAHHHHQATHNPNDRVRNLRGNGPPRHQMPPQHHLPPPSYHHFSPLTNVTSSGRGDRYSGYPLLPHQLDLLTSSSSKRKCVPIKPPIPSKFQGDVEKYKDAQIPEFNNLVNFPGHMSNKPSPNVPEGMRCCVMCGQACPCSTGGKSKKPVYTSSVTSFSGGGGAGSTSGNVAPLGDSTGSNTNKGVVSASSNAMNPFSAATIGNYATIPTQNKGLCTICDVNVWLVTSSGLEIKWCKGCKNFRPWAAFGDKGLATKCVRCRERQREKYALTKEEKDKKKGAVKEDLHFVNPQQHQQLDPPMSYQ